MRHFSDPSLMLLGEGTVKALAHALPYCLTR